MLRFLESEPDRRARSYLETFEAEHALSRRMRGCLAPFVLAVVGGWLGVLVILLFLEGFHVGGFDLGDGVLASAVGATAIFGLLGIVLRHYFPRRSDRQ
jgi:hypothetical protein